MWRTVSYQRQPGTDHKGLLPDDDEQVARVNHAAVWYDGLGWTKAQAFFGTDDDHEDFPNSESQYNDGPPAHGQDDVMVTATVQSYEGIELRRTVTDNAGREHQTRHDTLGRVVRSIENVVGDGDVTGTTAILSRGDGARGLGCRVGQAFEVVQGFGGGFGGDGEGQVDVGIGVGE